MERRENRKEEGGYHHMSDGHIDCVSRTEVKSRHKRWHDTGTHI